MSMTAFNVAPLGRWLQVNCVPRMLMINRCQNILFKKERTNICSSTFCRYTGQGRIQDFKLGGGAFKKIAPSGGKREKFGVFRVKNHDFTPKIHIFANFKGGAHLDPPLLGTVYLLTNPYALKYALKQLSSMRNTFSLWHIYAFSKRKGSYSMRDLAFSWHRLLDYLDACKW